MSEKTLPITPAAVAWIKALLSGNYVQGKNRLGTAAIGDRGPQEFCCLGVAAATCFPNLITWEEFQDPDSEDEQIAMRLRLTHRSSPEIVVSTTDVLPTDLWVELIGGNNTLKEEEDETHWLSYQTSLADANDNGVSFEHIVYCYILPMFGLTREQFEEQYGPVPQQS